MTNKIWRERAEARIKNSTREDVLAWAEKNPHRIYISELAYAISSKKGMEKEIEYHKFLRYAEAIREEEYSKEHKG